MNDELEKLRPEVRKAVQELDGKAYPGSQTHTRWQTIRAELLRLAMIETDALIALDCEHDWQVMRERAERAEAELAALKARIFQGIILDVDDLARGHAGLPSEWRGKRVLLVVEE